MTIESELMKDEMNKEPRLTLDEALREAREQLASTRVPEQDAAVAKAHMLAAFTRAQAQPKLAAAPARTNFVGAVSLSAAGSPESNLHESGFFAKRSGLIALFFILILLSIWLLMPVNISASNDIIAQVSSYQTSSSSLVQKTSFMPLVDSDTLAQARQGWVISTELQVAQLAELGLPFDATRAAETVPAEYLMSESGEILGVRLIQNAAAVITSTTKT